MRQELEKIERIEKYLLGELTGDELLLFESELKNNFQLKGEVELQRLIMLGVENASLKKSLSHIHYVQYDNSFSYYFRTWGKWIMGGLLLIAISGYLIFFYIEKNPENIKKTNPALSYSLKTNKDTVLEMETETDMLSDETESVTVGSDWKMDSHPVKLFSDAVISDYFYLNPNRDTIITGRKGTRINIPSGSFVDENGRLVSKDFLFQLKEIYKKSEIILNDLAGNVSASVESTGGIYIDAKHNNKQLKLGSGKQIEVDFYEGNIPHVSNPHEEIPPSREKEDYVYYKVFDDQTEKRIIVLPAVVLDYDIIYTRKSADPLMNERIESLLFPEFENTFTSTTQFHYRIEGCQLYGDGVNLLDIYLNNVHLKLWEVDSLVCDYLAFRVKDDCRNFAKYMKALEYFRWLKSLKHGKVQRIKRLDYRNYRKGQFYNKLPDKALEKYLLESGLSKEESYELIGYFKKMFFFKKMFYRKTKLSDKKEQYANLDYYYEKEGCFARFEKDVCLGKVNIENKSKYVYKAGNQLGAATELNYFLPVNKLGWINSDKFINYKNTASLKVLLKGIDTSCYSKVYIVFDDVYAVLGGKWTKDQYNFFERVPKGSKVYLVALSYHNNSLYYARKEILAGEQSEESLNLKLTDEFRIKQDLMLLDN